eukprot:9234543-Pyramimonas_sp.AAC.1
MRERVPRCSRGLIQQGSLGGAETGGHSMSLPVPRSGLLPFPVNELEDGGGGRRRESCLLYTSDAADDTPC